MNADGKKLIDVLMMERDQLLRERDALKAEVERLEADRDAWKETGQGLFDSLTAHVAEKDALKAESERLMAALSRLETWTHEMGAELKPKRADSYGEGMRDAKGQAAALIAALNGRPEKASET